MVLLERDSHLRELHDHVSAATAGQGGIVMVGGEAGSGKSSLIMKFRAELGAGVTVLLATCDNLPAPAPFGPMRDLGLELGLDAAALNAGQPRAGVFRVVLDALVRRPPGVLIVEDAHWADGVTLDFLRFLARRIGIHRALAIVTYRDDEIGARHPLRRCLGDLATTPSVRRMHVPPLSASAVGRLAMASDRDGEAVFRLTGGNPFFVTEVLAAATDQVPATVVDAILARAGRLPGPARAVLDLAAVIGTEVGSGVLLDTTGTVVEEIDACVDGGLLVVEADSLRFRHGLVREAVLGALPPLRRRLLHRKVLEALRNGAGATASAELLAHHAEAAGDGAAVLEYAGVAARQARALMAHREAAAQFARCLRFASTLPESDRAQLLSDFAASAHLSLQTAESVTALEEALASWRKLDDQPRIVETLHDLATAYHYVGRLQESADRLAEAIELLKSSPPSPMLALAFANLTHVHHLAGSPETGRVIADHSVQLAERAGDEATLVDVLLTVGSARMYAGGDQGRVHLERGLRLALAAGLVSRAVRAQLHLIGAFLSLKRLDLAEHWLREALKYVTDHELKEHRSFLRAREAQLWMSRGAWSEAAARAREIDSDPDSPAWSRIAALMVLARIQVRRGGHEAEATLTSAIELVEEVGAIHFLEAIYAIRSELAYFAGDPARARDESRLLREVVELRANPWARGECALLAWQAGDPDWLRENLARPYALEIAGRPEAAVAWRDLGWPYEEARALARSDDPAALLSALNTFERLGARPASTQVRDRLRRLGVRDVPSPRRGPSQATLAHPAGLTPREAEVLALLTTGLSNADLAARLYLTPKTVSHHLTSIYAKLGVTNRAQAARLAGQLGTTIADA